MMSRFVEVFKQMWVMNGDHLSRLYAGTGALGSGRSKVSSNPVLLYFSRDSDALYSCHLVALML